ncbi:hypothetical protein B9479_008206 [Cryptococcus floricola]|uniref:Uncharacterized protein n=1 Tax=Cryptococcus floricola TaxID=2591691 RepID=A0A5D3ANK4_9TREE|nr:hypothetical protein B9479_008206 [Cryptococcus floricola]
MPPAPNDIPPSDDDAQQTNPAPNSTATGSRVRVSTPSRIDDQQDEDDTSRMRSSSSQPKPSNPDSSEEETRPAHHPDLASMTLNSVNYGKCHVNTVFEGARFASGGLGELGGSSPRTRGGFWSFDYSRNTERRNDGTSSGGGGRRAGVARAEGEEVTREGSAFDDRAPTPENEGNEEDRKALVDWLTLQDDAEE